jgi:hypothetical protein
MSCDVTSAVDLERPRDEVWRCFDMIGGSVKEAPTVKLSLNPNKQRLTPGTGRGTPVPNHRVRRRSFHMVRDIFAAELEINLGSSGAMLDSLERVSDVLA